VSPVNPAFASIDGVLYTKDFKTLLRCPLGKAGEVVVPDTTTAVENAAFIDCAALTRVVIGHGVSRIAEDAFLGCTGLTHVVIGDSFIDTASPWWLYFFEGSPELAAIDVSPLNPAFASVDGVLYTKDLKTLLRCPLGKRGEILIPGTTTTIESAAFELVRGVTAVYFQGDAPSLIGLPLEAAAFATVFYLPDTSGWGAEFSGRPTAIWEPAVADDSVGRDADTGEFGFAIDWAGDRSVVVEGCTDLTLGNWAPLATVALSDGQAWFRDPGSPAMGGRFYRVRRP
jgi:hypothetical protein